jgi:serine/threonine protein kinase
MVTGTFPFEARRKEDIITLIIEGDWAFPSNLKLSNQVKDLITVCLSKDPQDRPSAGQIIKH